MLLTEMETWIERKCKQPCFWCLENEKGKIRVSKSGNNNKELGFLIEEIEGLTGKKSHLNYTGENYLMSRIREVSKSIPLSPD